jgi:hypothetical protein
MDYLVNLVGCVFNRAVLDIVNCPNADPLVFRPMRKKKCHDRLPESYYDSADAQRFINRNNPSFQFYCDLLDFDYEWTEQKLNKAVHVALHNNSKKRDLRKIDRNNLAGICLQ